MVVLVRAQAFAHVQRTGAVLHAQYVYIVFLPMDYLFLIFSSGLFSRMFKWRHLQYWEYMHMPIDMDWISMHNTYVFFWFLWNIVVHSPETIYLSVCFLYFPAVCSPVCLNGGTCNAGNTCSCLSTWAGSRCATREFCQMPLNLVFELRCFPLAVCPSGCFNGGWCSSPGVCTCTSQWTGSTCTTRKSDR